MSIKESQYQALPYGVLKKNCIKDNPARIKKDTVRLHLLPTLLSCPPRINKTVKRDSVSSADYDPVIAEAIKANANELKQLSTSGKAAQQARFARGAQELDNAVKRAVDEDVIAAARKTGETGGNNPNNRREIWEKRSFLSPSLSSSSFTPNIC
ncbi:hypothetical protein CPSG_06530 [Coccidioides posadasii str. Silveira]|uniref:Uncharacterized protein n=1 Tax=Coccidioides posadasii (strain RMSCC 757 / Silveira) TaxID=443226 RepID=E9DAE9_COCPS|nr:hypothetical protein CPSG_06530 [Coccidioides posadasii str. Silveira]